TGNASSEIATSIIGNIRTQIKGFVADK
ncbi:hypothetical protein CI957_2006, partial [Methanohalophilus sp. WG1-DM]